MARYADQEMLDALTRDRESADAFVSSTLGDLALAARALRRTC
ncbi:hypothetical protein [Amycolatopsis palatopharyngis]|nr:hypothetical protein [Amycolatopsis palatopharyngis]